VSKRLVFERTTKRRTGSPGLTGSASMALGFPACAYCQDCSYPKTFSWHVKAVGIEKNRNNIAPILLVCSYKNNYSAE
jgi:hypothetical protein